jgi:peptidoglycan/LPS O-acetylase OafA/YrhL
MTAPLSDTDRGRERQRVAHDGFARPFGLGRANGRWSGSGAGLWSRTEAPDRAVPRPEDHRPPDLKAHTGMRGIAALAVVFYHLGLFHLGYLGVDFFFVLSGFIIHHVYRRTFSRRLAVPDIAAFIQNRFARIYPVHAVTLAAMLVLFGLALALGRPIGDASAFRPVAVLLSLALLHGWFDVPSPNIPAWSVSAEWFAYLAYPFVAAGFAGRSVATRCAVIAGLLLWMGVEHDPHPLMRIAPEFLLGMAIYDVSDHYELSQRLPRYSGVIVVMTMIASICLVQAEFLGLRVGLFAALIVVATHPEDGVARVLSHPALCYLGEISYSIYMTHGVVWAVLKNVLRTAAPQVDPAGPFIIAGAVAGVLIASAACYHVVELPARRLIRGLGRGGSRA